MHHSRSGYASGLFPVPCSRLSTLPLPQLVFHRSPSMQHALYIVEMAGVVGHEEGIPTP